MYSSWCWIEIRSDETPLMPSGLHTKTDSLAIDRNVTLTFHSDILLDFGLDHPDPEGYIRGGLEYLHRSPASRKRQRKGDPVPGG
jgi:hypothetical protein